MVYWILRCKHYIQNLSSRPKNALNLEWRATRMLDEMLRPTDDFPLKTLETKSRRNAHWKLIILATGSYGWMDNFLSRGGQAETWSGYPGLTAGMDWVIFHVGQKVKRNFQRDTISPYVNG